MVEPIGWLWNPFLGSGTDIVAVFGVHVRLCVTPNDDGTNDFWNLNGLEQYPSAEITVFNRWGDVLFTQGANDGAWDGKVNGILVPVGTYYYHIRVNEPALQTEWTGPITIMR